jgi:ABC-type glutathione transport system ATPase component
MPVDSGLISGILGSAGAGTALIVIMILTGILNTKRYTDRIEAEAQYWKGAAETERQASVAKDTAVAAATQRADAAVEVAALTKEILEDLRRRTDAAAKTQAQ